jgi:hypothetical protein
LLEVLVQFFKRRGFGNNASILDCYPSVFVPPEQIFSMLFQPIHAVVD